MRKAKRYSLLLVLLLLASLPLFSEVVLTDEEAQEIDLALTESIKDLENSNEELIEVNKELTKVSSELNLSMEATIELQKDLKVQERLYEEQLIEERRRSLILGIVIGGGSVVFLAGLGFGIAYAAGAF